MYDGAVEDYVSSWNNLNHLTIRLTDVLMGVSVSVHGAWDAIARFLSQLDSDSVPLRKIFLVRRADPAMEARMRPGPLSMWLQSLGSGDPKLMGTLADIDDSAFPTLEHFTLVTSDKMTEEGIRQCQAAFPKLHARGVLSVREMCPEKVSFMSALLDHGRVS